MAILTVNNPALAGQDPGYVAAAGGGDSFPNSLDCNTYVHFRTSGTGITVTFDAPGTCNFGAAANSAHDVAVVLPATGDRVIGPFRADRFNDANGRVQMTYTAVTGLTVAVVQYTNR